MNPLACPHPHRYRFVPVLDSEGTIGNICGLCAVVLLDDLRRYRESLTIVLAAPSEVLVSQPAQVTV